MNAPLPHNENERLAWLRQSRILDTPAEDAFDDITRLAAQVCGVPIAAVSLIDEERQWFKSIVGLPVSETTRDVAFCAHTILQPEVMIVPDATQDDRFRDNPLVTGQPDIRFYAGAPLVTENGLALGSLCVIDRQPRQLTAEQRAVLEVLARQVAGRIELQRHVVLLNEMMAERVALEAERVRAQEAMGEAHERLIASEQRLRLALESGGLGTWHIDLTALPLLDVSPTWRAHFGLAPEERADLDRVFQAIHPDDRDRMRQTLQKAVASHGSFQAEHRVVWPDGTIHWISVHAKPTDAAPGEPQSLIGVTQEVTGRRGADEALRHSNRALQESQARLIEAQHIGGIGDWELDVTTRRSIWSAEVFRLLEFDPAEGEPPYEAVLARYHPDDRAERDHLFARGRETGEPYQYDVRLLLPSGTSRCCHLVGRPILDAAGGLARVVGTMLDITEQVEREQQLTDANLVLKVQKAQLQAANAELAALTTTDPLTGLPNHRAFHARLKDETARAEREGATLAVVMLDLNNFGFFNDAHGHVVGDEVLRQVAERLQRVCRPYDTVARFGGDEFALILPGVGSASASEIEARLRTDMGGLTHRLEELETAIPVTLSLGVALSSRLGLDHQQLLQHADERLRRAKSGGDAETVADQVRRSAQGAVAGFSMLDALVTAVDNKDRYTCEHSEGVMEYSLMIARELGLDGEAQHTIAVAALLHDVGKIGVPDCILRKPGRLTDAEFAAIQQHPTMGAALVSTVPGLEDTLDAVRHHHERWDGGGYPFGLRGEHIPLMARLMAVADAFSAMTTDRPYRKGFESRKALSILSAGAGTQWDPQCVAVFVKALSQQQKKSLTV